MKNNSPQDILCSIVARFGENVFRESRLLGLINDLVEDDREKRLLRMTAKENIPAALLNIKHLPANEQTIEINKLKLKLKDTTFWEMETVHFAMDAFAYALGIKTGKSDDEILAEFQQLYRKHSVIYASSIIRQKFLQVEAFPVGQSVKDIG